MVLKSIQFIPMTNEEYAKFYEYSIKDYANDLIKSGKADEEDGIINAKEEFEYLLPEGLKTQDNYIVNLLNESNLIVGSLWYRKLNETTGFICDILIFKEYQGNGYGKLTLLELENHMRDLVLKQIVLHVFAFNNTAIGLYHKIGYEQMSEEEQGSFYMKKSI